MTERAGHRTPTGRRAVVLVAAALAPFAGAWLRWSSVPHAKGQVPPRAADATPVAQCTVRGQMHAEPTRLSLDQELTVTMSASADCVAPMENHVVLVVDGSEAMDSTAGRRLHDAARRLGEIMLDSGSTNPTLVGVVTFDGSARRLAHLTDRPAVIDTAMDRLDARPGARIDLGLSLTHTVLRVGRSPARGRAITEAAIVFSPGRNDTRCEMAVSAAKVLKDDGILIVTVCDSHDCDRDCSARIASSPRYVLSIGLGGAFPSSVFRRTYAIPVAAWDIQTSLGDAFAYVAGSARPEPRPVATDARALRWAKEDDAAGAITVTLRLRPLESGEHPVVLAATGVVSDSLGGSTTWLFDVPAVTVLSPTPTPGSTADPTGPPPPTLAPSATATPTSDGTPSRAAPVYLPLVRAWPSPP